MYIEIIFAILMFLGIILTAIPTTPGMIYMLLIALIYGIVDKFETLEPWHFAIFGGLVITSILADYLSGLIGAKFGGANKKSVLAGFIGMIIGFFSFPPFGLFAGLFLGVLIAELAQMKEHTKALKAASFSLIGIVTGMIVNVTLAIAFFTTFMIIIL